MDAQHGEKRPIDPSEIPDDDPQVQKILAEMEAKEDHRPAWQRTKESWYDKVPLSLRQLDVIIGVGLAALVVVAILIALDAGGIL